MSAGIGASAAVAEGMRRYWRRREQRQQEEFTNAVSRIVDAKLEASKTAIIAEIRRSRAPRSRSS